VVKGHEGEIDVLSWSWGMSQSGTTHTGTGGGAGKVSVEDLTFVHNVDSSTPVLMKACCSGKHFETAKLILRKAGEKPLDYVIIDLSHCIITQISTGGSEGEESLTETVSLNFNEYKYMYQPQDKTGAAKGGSIDVDYDIAKNA